MAIQVIIKRKIKQGHQAKKIVPIIRQMRIHAMHQPGYISGETLYGIENPGLCIVFSKWQTVEDWEKWSQSLERTNMDAKIESLTGEKTEYQIYSYLLPETFSK